MIGNLRYLIFPVLNIVGLLLSALGALLFACGVLSLMLADGVATNFFWSTTACLLAAVFLLLLSFRDKRKFMPRDAFLLASLTWTLVPLFACLPIYLLPGCSFSASYFEAMSGITTTCATAFSVESLPASINFWRCFLSWLGGMGILMLAVLLLPLMGVGGSQLFRFVNLCQSSPSTSSLFGLDNSPSRLFLSQDAHPEDHFEAIPQLANTAHALWHVYLVLSLACCLLYKLAGMSWWDAILHTFSTVSLGGFSSHDLSFAYWSNPAIEAVCVLFMVLGGMNFSLHLFAWKKRSLLPYFRHSEACAWCFVLLLGIFGVTFVLWSKGAYEGLGQALRASLFNVVSVASTTGFSSVDYTSWPATVTIPMLCLAIFASCSGSAGGGIKMMRAIILVKQLSRGLTQTLYPKAIVPLRLNRVQVPDPLVFSVLNYLLLWIATLLLASLGLIGLGLDLGTAFSAALACMTNTGPGLGAVGPASVYGVLSSPQLWLCTFCMFIGRLEIVTVFVLFTREFWRL